MEAKFPLEVAMVHKLYQLKACHVLDYSEIYPSDVVVVLDIIKRYPDRKPKWMHIDSPDVIDNTNDLLDNAKLRYVQFGFIDRKTGESTIVDLPFKKFLTIFEPVPTTEEGH